MKYSMVVFDMAGTTVFDEDNAVASCLRDALVAAGCPITLEAVDPVMGMPKPLAVRELLAQSRGEAPTDSEVERVHADFQRRIIDHYRTGPSVKEIDGASDLFSSLRKAGVRVALDTGFDRATANTIIERLGWGGGLIDDSVTSDEVANGRPHADMIEVLMQRAGIDDPAQVVKVGDSISDIEQGLNARCGCVVAIAGRRTSGAEDRFEGVRVIDHIGRLPEVL